MLALIQKRQVSHLGAVMRASRIIEQGSAERIFTTRRRIARGC